MNECYVFYNAFMVFGIFFLSADKLHFSNSSSKIKKKSMTSSFSNPVFKTSKTKIKNDHSGMQHDYIMLIYRLPILVNSLSS